MPIYINMVLQRMQDINTSFFQYSCGFVMNPYPFGETA